MNLIQFITLIVIILIIVGVILYFNKKRKIKNSLVELKCNFYISENSDELLEQYKKETGVLVDGILGNDFLNKHNYIIDYNSLLIKHNSVKISIKESIDILQLPLIVLYQGSRKYIFMVDTGATDSMIHSKCLNHLDYTEHEYDVFEVCGFGGSGITSKMISSSLYYAKKKVEAN